MDQAAATLWGAIGGGIAGSILLVATEWIRLYRHARRERRKLRIWLYLWPRAHNTVLDRERVLRECDWLCGEKEYHALVYEMLREGTILPNPPLEVLPPDPNTSPPESGGTTVPLQT